MGIFFRELSNFPQVSRRQVVLLEGRQCSTITHERNTMSFIFRNGAIILKLPEFGV